MKNSLKLKQDKQIVSIAHSIFLKQNYILYKNLIFNVFPIPTSFKLQRKKEGVSDNKAEFIFLSESGQQLLVYGKPPLSTWKLEKTLNSNSEKLFTFNQGKISDWIEINTEIPNSIFKNKKNDYILRTKNDTFIFLEYLNPIQNYDLPLTSKVLLESGNFVDIGEPITEGIIDVHELLNILFKYHSTFDGILLGSIRSLNKFQILLINSIQSIYQSQGVNISSKHIEIIVRQMTSKVVIKESGDSPLLPGELVRLSLITEIYHSLKESNTKIPYKTPKYEPILLSSTNASLSKDGFLSAAGFQETKRVLTKAAIEGTSDWLRGLKECIIIGRLIPAGSAFLNYKNYLDNIYLFKNQT